MSVEDPLILVAVSLSSHLSRCWKVRYLQVKSESFIIIIETIIVNTAKHICHNRD